MSEKNPEYVKNVYPKIVSLYGTVSKHPHKVVLEEQLTSLNDSFSILEEIHINFKNDELAETVQMIQVNICGINVCNRILHDLEEKYYGDDNIHIINLTESIKYNKFPQSEEKGLPIFGEANDKIVIEFYISNNYIWGNDSIDVKFVGRNSAEISANDTVVVTVLNNEYYVKNGTQGNRQIIFLKNIKNNTKKYVLKLMNTDDAETEDPLLDELTFQINGHDVNDRSHPNYYYNEELKQYEIELKKSGGNSMRNIACKYKVCGERNDVTTSIFIENYEEKFEVTPTGKWELIKF
jgi:hypothetical protein